MPVSYNPWVYLYLILKWHLPQNWIHVYLQQSFSVLLSDFDLICSTVVSSSRYEISHWLGKRWTNHWYELQTVFVRDFHHLYKKYHYDNITWSNRVSQNTGNFTVYSTGYSGCQERKHGSSPLLAFDSSPHKRPVMQKAFTLCHMYPIWHNLTHWGCVTHICISKQTTIASDNGLSPGPRQAIVWTNAGTLLIDRSHIYGHPQAACREPAGSYDKTTRTAICFEHKTQYLLIRAPSTHIVVFWHISNIPPMISQSQISCNTPTFYIAAIIVKYCYTTGSWLL